MADAPSRHAHRPRRLVSGLTRARLPELLREVDRKRSVSELAGELGLHTNTVREQLDDLVRAGLVERTAEAPRGRGRPALLYRATPEVDEAAPYRHLARVLADELAVVPDPSTRAIAAGERWGRGAIRGPGRSDSDADPGTHDTHPTRDPGAADPVDRLIALLDENGFAPEPLAAGQPLRLRRCPFLPLATDQPGIVCGVHLGLMRGALAELGAPLDAVRLEPFVEPDLCLAHLASRDRPSAD